MKRLTTGITTVLLFLSGCMLLPQIEWRDRPERIVIATGGDVLDVTVNTGSLTGKDRPLTPSMRSSSCRAIEPPQCCRHGGMP